MRRIKCDNGSVMGGVRVGEDARIIVGMVLKFRWLMKKSVTCVSEE